MAKLFDWCHCRHPRVAKYLSWLYALALVAGIFGGGYAVGTLVSWSQASSVITQQREDYQASLKLLSGNLARAAEATATTAGSMEQTAGAVQEVVATAKGAAKTAGTAAITARGAAHTAKAAATTARTAAQDVSEALAPQPPPEPKDAPDWLGGP